MFELTVAFRYSCEYEAISPTLLGGGAAHEFSHNRSISGDGIATSELPQLLLSDVDVV